METKTISDEVAELAHLYAFDKIGSTGLYHAFIAGYTAAQSEQSEMVKKSEMVYKFENLLEPHYYIDADQVQRAYNNALDKALQILTDLLETTKLKDL